MRRTAEVQDPLKISVFTIFPELIEGYFGQGLVGQALQRGEVMLEVLDLRNWAEDPRRSVDDAPFGGGPGMVLAPEPLFRAVEAADPPRPLFLLGPMGRKLDQRLVRELASMRPGFSLLCGRYEGVDERVRENLVDGELSIGDFVLAGGELAAMSVIEAVFRLVPGVMGNFRSAEEESFEDGLLEYPHYTRPAVFRGLEVPEVLRSGDHVRIASWRRAQSLARTLELRPDLIEGRGGLSQEELALLAYWGLALGSDPK
jgi:tRNA (guanine37-N1)-methyltransferase